MDRIGVQKPHNKRMQEFLRSNGFPYAVVKYMEKGSLQGSWRVYSRPKISVKDRRNKNILEIYDKWSPEVADKLNSLGFSNLWGKPLGQFDGNGGLLSVFVRGRKEFLQEGNNG